MEKDKPKKGRPKKAVVTTETFTEVARNDWNSEDECGLFMASLMKMAKYSTVLEIGVFEGETAQHLINALPKGGLYVGIDINDYRTDATKLYMADGGKAIEFILGNSLTELSKLPTAHFDLIFIDADHSFGHVLQEFKLAEKLVSRGGVIILHDTIHLEGPRKLVEYAAHFGYKNITLNTTEGRGLSILHR
jgi:predicted O-methyltransferase YrrM